MAWLEKTYHLKSSVEMMHHNGQLIDRLNPYAKALAKISAKKKKTDADYEEMAHIEFLGSLYIGADGEPIVPQHMLSAMLVVAAKKFKEGNQAKSGMYVKDHAKLIYDGPKVPEEMYQEKSKRFVDRRNVRVGQASIMRTRAIFAEWEIDVTVVYEDTIVDVSRIDEWFITAGHIVGLAEIRPQYGRFEVFVAN
ncbi:MAG: hypothetical protein V1775_02235 [Bacteroidota bacterium]